MTLTYNEKIIRKGLLKITRNENQKNENIGDVDIIEEYPVIISDGLSLTNTRVASNPSLARRLSNSSNKSLDIDKDKKKFLGGIFGSKNENKNEGNGAKNSQKMDNNGNNVLKDKSKNDRSFESESVLYPLETPTPHTPTKEPPVNISSRPVFYPSPRLDYRWAVLLHL
jgi:hypothetical protein